MEQSEEMIRLAIEIAAYEQERVDLTRIIQTLDAELMRETDEDGLLYMNEIIDRYKTVLRKLKVLLECYFKEEQDNNMPTDFLYRKYYKRLLEAMI